MNNFTTSEYILAQVKRSIQLALDRTKAALEMYRKDKGYGSSELEARIRTFRQVQSMILTIEADAVLGEPTIGDEQYAAIDEEGEE